MCFLERSPITHMLSYARLGVNSTLAIKNPEALNQSWGVESSLVCELEFPKVRGTFLKGPHHKDHRILGVYIGAPLFWETTWRVRGLSK